MSSAGQSGGTTAQPVCQFSGDACSTQSGHYRKVISHIFGRNKKCTVGIPDYVWIYYCRKHYQRARYRTGEWPFRQCDLAMDIVHNMREWGGVENFNLQLRRRETKRTSSGSDETGEAAQDEATPGPSQSTSQTPSRRASTAAASPADPHSSVPPSPTGQSVKVEDTDDADDNTQHEDDDEDDGETATNNTESTPTNKKKSPTIVPRPVPDWLHSRIGERKTFDQILQVLQDLRGHMLGMVDRDEDPHFPDIEILPNLRPRAAADKKSGHKRRGSSMRVSEKGGIKKTDERN